MTVRLRQHMRVGHTFLCHTCMWISPCYTAHACATHAQNSCIAHSSRHTLSVGVGVWHWNWFCAAGLRPGRIGSDGRERRLCILSHMQTYPLAPTHTPAPSACQITSIDRLHVLLLSAGLRPDGRGRLGAPSYRAGPAVPRCRVDGCLQPPGSGAVSRSEHQQGLLHRTRNDSKGMLPACMCICQMHLPCMCLC